MKDSKELKNQELIDYLEQLEMEIQEKDYQLEQKDKIVSEMKQSIQMLLSKNSEMQEELQKALSQIQSQAEIIKSQNDKIETMSESDLQLKEAEKKLEIVESINQSLDKKIDEAKSQMHQAELAIKESKEQEKYVKQQRKNMQEIIDDSVAFRTEKARNKLELKYKAVHSILIIYGIAMTIIVGIRNRLIVNDIIEAWRFIVEGINNISKLFIGIAQKVALISQYCPAGIEKTVSRIVFVLIIILEIVIGGIVGYKVGKQFVKWFKKRMGDRWSLIALMIDFVLIIIGCDVLKKYVGVNLVLAVAINYLGYVMIRGIVGAKDKSMRNVILVYSGGIVVIVAVAAVVIGSFVNR